MKHLLFLSIMLFLTNVTKAQDITTITNEEDFSSYWQISARGGYDLYQNYKNNPKYVKYGQGLTGGISLDKYIHWLGFGLDADYIENEVENSYPTDLTTMYEDQNSNIYGDGTITQNDITRWFIGIGPNAKYQSESNRVTIELNTRAGISKVDGGYVQTTAYGKNGLTILNEHGGYDEKVAAAKAQLRANFWPLKKKQFGINIGGNFINHFKTGEVSSSSVFEQYALVTNATASPIIISTPITVRNTASKKDLQSAGISLGFSYRFRSQPTKTVVKKEVVYIEKEVEVPVQPTLYGLTVIVKDRPTGQHIPQADVVVKDESGNIVKTGTTNSLGAVSFENLEAKNYFINGQVYTVATTANQVSLEEFTQANLTKELFYEDMRFILKGKTIDTYTKQPKSDVMVSLKNKMAGNMKQSTSSTNGEFAFQLDKETSYDVYGTKKGEFSETEQVSTIGLSRSTTLFVELELGIAIPQCNEAVQLKNIYFDLDKFDVKPNAQFELDRVYQLLIENPTMVIEMSSHTDSRGSHEYNRTLSQKRAESTKAYLVKKGISSQRIQAVGYGETQLINQCADGVKCTEEEHQLNRRTEMKVTCE